MSDAEKAYVEAQRLIAEALASGVGILELNTEKTHYLTTLPPEIADLTRITTLYLNGTQVTDFTPIAGMAGITTLTLNNAQIKDLSPLAGMMGITRLYLGDTQISDLTPIADMTGIISLGLDFTLITDLSPLVGMRRLTDLTLARTQVADLRPLLPLSKLAEGSDLFGLRFDNIPATKRDPKLAELSKIEDPKERTTKTFAYLREVGENWPPLPASAPDQDTILTVTQFDDGRLDISPATPDAKELTDAVKRKAHALLQQASKSLEQITGNMHPRLSASARTLSLHIDCPLQDIDMLNVHFELEALRGTYERRGERKAEDIFGDEVIDALDKVLMIGPGLVLDNAEVEKLEARRDRYRGEPPTPDVQDAQDKLSDGIAIDPTLFGDTMRGYSVTFKEGHAEGSERLQVGQGILNKNTLVYVGAFVVSGMAGGPLSAFGNDLLAWFIAQSETISILAPTWGRAFEAWITPIVMRAREANVAARGILKRPE